MSDDISTQFTKEKNNKRGRHGFCGWKYEKVTKISPKDWHVYTGKKKKRKSRILQKGEYKNGQTCDIYRNILAQKRTDH